LLNQPKKKNQDGKKEDIFLQPSSANQQRQVKG